MPVAVRLAVKLRWPQPGGKKVGAGLCRRGGRKREGVEAHPLALRSTRRPSTFRARLSAATLKRPPLLSVLRWIAYAVCARLSGSGSRAIRWESTTRVERAVPPDGRDPLVAEPSFEAFLDVSLPLRESGRVASAHRPPSRAYGPPKVRAGLAVPVRPQLRIGPTWVRAMR